MFSYSNPDPKPRGRSPHFSLSPNSLKIFTLQPKIGSPRPSFSRPLSHNQIRAGVGCFDRFQPAPRNLRGRRLASLSTTPAGQRITAQIARYRLTAEWTTGICAALSNRVNVSISSGFGTGMGGRVRQLGINPRSHAAIL